MRVQSLASLSGVRIWHSCELWCRLQTRPGSSIAMAVDIGWQVALIWPLAWEFPYAETMALKSKKASKQTKTEYRSSLMAQCVGIQYYHSASWVAAVAQVWSLAQELLYAKKNKNWIQERVPIVAQWKQIRLVTMRLQVWSLASISGLRIWHCCQLWCGLQTWLSSCVAVAYVDSCSWDLTPSLGTCIFRGCGPKKRKEKD